MSRTRRTCRGISICTASSDRHKACSPRLFTLKIYFYGQLFTKGSAAVHLQTLRPVFARVRAPGRQRHAGSSATLSAATGALRDTCRHPPAPKSSGNFVGELGFKVNSTSVPAGVHPLHEPVLTLSWVSHLCGYGATTLSKEQKIQGPCPKVHRKNSTAWCFPSPIPSIPCIFLPKASIIFFPSAHLNYI